MKRTRYHRIVAFFAKTLFSLAVWELLFPRIGLRKLAQRSRPARLSKIGSKFRKLAIEMGGVLIKVGQFLSARMDILPTEITRELAGLQDEVPPEPFSAIRTVVEDAFGQPLEVKFSAFHTVPVAAASLGQVHHAEINGQRVMVKVQRPDIDQVIATDLAALRTVGEWLRKYPAIHKRADVRALLAEFTRILEEEVDYEAEGRNAEQFAKNFAGRAGVVVPQIFWSHTNRKVLALEDVSGIKISDYAAIRAAGIDQKEVAKRLFDTYLKQIFEDGFFHGDPHPGNLFVQARVEDSAAGGPGLWTLTFVDFGMVGRVPDNLRQGMRDLVIAVGTRDARRLVTAYQNLGILLPQADLDLLQKAEQKVFDQFWGKTMSELKEIGPEQIKAFTIEFKELVYEMPFQVPQDLILLGRTVGILSGMCTGLDPEFNVWEGLAPYAKKMIAEETSAGRGTLLDELSGLAKNLLGYPRRVDQMLDRVEQGKLVMHDPQLKLEVRRLTNAVEKATSGILATGFLVGGVQLYIHQQTEFAWFLLAAAALSFAWLMLKPRQP